LYANRIANIFSETNGGAGGILGAAVVMKAVSTIGGTVRASVGNGATIGTNAGKPSSLSVKAEDYSTAKANATVGSGALGFSAGGSTTEATASPTVDAFIGSNVKIVLADGLGHDVTVTALVDDAEADAQAKSFSGALGITVGAPYARAFSEPSVHAYIGSGTTIVAGGAVKVDAESNATGKLPPLDDYIKGLTPDDGSTVASATEDSVTFLSHGLNTGDQVLYQSTCSCPISGLHDNHQYGVIVLDENTLRFGATFTGASIDADSVGRVQGVDTNRSMIRTVAPHDLETGDAVIYRTAGPSISSSFGDGQVLYVRKIDDFTFELYTALAAATSPVLDFTSVSSNLINDGGQFADGQRVTYKSPAPLYFGNKSVDVSTDALFGIHPSGDCSGCNDIYLGYHDPVTSTSDGDLFGHGLFEGEAVIYQVSDPSMHIVGLTDGGLYYVHLGGGGAGLLDGSFTVQLATSYCKATGDGCSQDLIALGRSGVTNADGATHALRPAPIHGLTDGFTYTVRRDDGTHIALQPAGGGGDITLSMTYPGSGGHVVVGGDSHDSNQHLFTAGAPLNTSLGCSGNPCGQQVYLKLTGSLPSTTSQKLLEPDGSSIRGSSPPSGNGETSASAGGGGGAAIAVAVPTSRVVVNPTVKSYVAASTVTVGGDFWVTSNVATRTHANSENGSGGLVAIPDVDASIVGDGDNKGVPGAHNNTSFIGADFGSDGITGDTAPGTAQVDGSGITIVAGGNVKLMATTFITSSIRAHTDSGGAGDFSNASALVRLDDNTTTIIGKNANVTGSTVALISKTGGNNTGTADSFVLALFGSSDDDMDFRLNSRANAILDGDTTSTGKVTGEHGVDVRAYHENETWSYSGSFTRICFDFHIGHDVDTNVTLSDTSSGHQGMTVVAAPRIILCSSPADTNCHTRDPFYATPLDTSTGDTNLALYVQAEFGANVDSPNTANRNIHWNSDVVLYAGPSPLLIVGADGKVVTSINIKVNGIWAPAPGDALTTYPSPVIEVDDLVNDDSGNVWMQSASGHIDGGVGTAVSPHWWGTFYYRDNWQKVTILNHSSRDLVIDNIDPINRDVNLHPRVKENAPGGDLADAKFSIVRQVDPTLITITNDFHPVSGAGPNLLINGFIDN